MNKSNDQSNSEKDSKESNNSSDNGLIPKPYDSFFRSAMQNILVATEFFNQELPATLSNILDFSTLQQRQTSYIDSNLQSTFSDICYDCYYSQTFLEQQQITDTNAPYTKIIILIEHQSNPDKFMPFRMMHYLMGALYTELQNNASALDKGLPVIYPLIYYHGDQSTDSFHSSFKDCFFDPSNIMDEVFTQDIPLININEYSDEKILENPLLAILNGFLKHGRKSRKPDYHGLDIFFPKLIATLNQIDFSNPMTLEYLKTGLNFIFNVGNITNVSEIMQQSQQLPQSPRDEVMTIAEQLIQKGREESAQALREAHATIAANQATIAANQAAIAANQAAIATEKHQIALNLLRSGLPLDFVAKNTNIDIETLKRLTDNGL